MITKGTLPQVLEVCSRAETPAGDKVDIAVVTPQILQQVETLSAQGLRLIGLAYREMGTASVIGKGEEQDMTFLGFDYLTFGVLLLVLHATPEQFRTGWFMESVASAAIIVLVIRSRRPFYKSRPGNQLLVATLAVVTAALILPFTPLGRIFGLVSLPLSFLLILALIMILYIFMAEVVKKAFYQRLNL
jgi:magnesium-transporting ATPase (P-type)